MTAARELDLIDVDLDAGEMSGTGLNMRIWISIREADDVWLSLGPRGYRLSAGQSSLNIPGNWTIS